MCLMTTLCLLAAGLGAGVGAGVGVAVAAPAQAEAPAGAHVSVRLAPGLSASEHSALARAGAFGAHPLRLLIVGDSIAMTLGMGLSVASQPDYGVSVIDDATVGCDLDPQMGVVTEGTPGPATQGCDNWRALWPFLVAAEHPQVVALGLGRWEVADHFENGQWVHIGEPAWDEHLTQDLEDAIAIFHTFGAKVVLLTMPYVDPSDRAPDGSPWPENSPARTQAYNALVRQVAQSDPADVSVLDLNHMLNPDGVYSGTLDGVDTRSSDGIHVSVAGGELLQRQILPAIGRIGMEDETTAAKARA